MLNVLKKGCIGFAALVVVLLLTVPCQASVVGKWSVSGTVTGKAIVNGGQTMTINIGFRDRFVFSSNKKFHMTGMNGTWRMKNGRFVIYLNAADIENTVEGILRGQGFNAEVDITSMTFSGRQNGAGINGNLTLKASFRVVGQSVRGSISISCPFAGKRIGTRAPEATADIAAESVFQNLQERLSAILFEEAVPLE